MSDIVVKVNEGYLRGKDFNSVGGGKYLSFTGIPYAEPPIGELRFKDPKPVKPWTGVKDATNESKKCAQVDEVTEVFDGEEDCLFLNIITSALSGKKAVIVWIHGGKFTKGSNNLDTQSPDYLINKDVVFVSINYRLNALGFLNMEYEGCSGNQGLKDQVLALRWLQQNIEAFGGDKDNITLMGGSAGAALIYLHCLSPMSKGLFHKAIMHSGVYVKNLAYKEENKVYGYELASSLGFTSSNPKEVVEYLRTIPVKTLVETSEVLETGYTSVDLLFLPTIDNKSAEPFFPHSLQNSVEQGIVHDIPIIMGYNTRDGSVLLLKNQTETINQFRENFEKCLHQLTRLNETPNTIKTAKDMRKFYFGDDEITIEKIDHVVSYFTDLTFVNSLQKTMEQQLKKPSSTYVYRFSYMSKTIKNTLFNHPLNGTCHGEELNYLLYAPSRPNIGKLQKGTKDHEIMERMTRMWTNFAKFGNPTPKGDAFLPTKWLPISPTQKNYMNIDENLVPAVNPDDESWTLWKRLYS